MEGVGGFLEAAGHLISDVRLNQSFSTTVSQRIGVPWKLGKGSFVSRAIVEVSLQPGAGCVLSIVKKLKVCLDNCSNLPVCHEMKTMEDFWTKEMWGCLTWLIYGSWASCDIFNLSAPKLCWIPLSPVVRLFQHILGLCSFQLSQCRYILLVAIKHVIMKWHCDVHMWALTLPTELHCFCRTHLPFVPITAIFRKRWEEGERPDPGQICCCKCPFTLRVIHF